jgi:hypothetical protein
MQDVINALCCTLRHRKIGKIPFDEVDAREMREILAVAGNQAVDDADLFAAEQELFCKVGSDEASATGDEV